MSDSGFGWVLGPLAMVASGQGQDKDNTSKQKRYVSVWAQENYRADQRLYCTAFSNGPLCLVHCLLSSVGQCPHNIYKTPGQAPNLLHSSKKTQKMSNQCQNRLKTRRLPPGDFQIQIYPSDSVKDFGRWVFLKCPWYKI